MKPKVSIISVISGNDIDFMSECLFSLLENTGYDNVETIAVCDAAPETRKFLTETAENFPKLHPVFREKKSGNAANRNLGAVSADKSSKYLLFTDSDVIYSDKNWLDKLVETLENDQTAGMAGSGGSTALGHYCHIDPETGLVVSSVMDFNGVIPVCPVEMMVIPGYNMLIRHSLFTETGGWDEGFFPVYGEDIDLCLRIILSGFRILSIHNPGVTHCYRDTGRNNSCERIPEDGRLWLTVASCRRLAIKYSDRLPTEKGESFSDWLEILEKMRSGDGCGASPLPLLPPTVINGRLNEMFLPKRDTEAVRTIFASLSYDY